MISGVSDPAGEERQRSSILDVVIQNPGTALTYVGLFAFAVLQFALAIYYGRFGVTPAEVGVTYASALTGSGPLLAIVAVAMASTAIGLKRLTQPIVNDVTELRRRIGLIDDAITTGRSSGQTETELAELQQHRESIARHVERLSQRSSWFQRTLGAILVAVPALWAALIIGTAFSTGVGPYRTSVVHPLPVHVSSVSLWVTDPNGDPQRLTGRRWGMSARASRFLLLGVDNGELVVYERNSRRVLRIDEGTVEVSQR